MKRHSKLYEKVYDFNNLYSAYKKASRNKSWKPATLNYTFNLEDNLLNLQDTLIKEEYKPGEYKEFYVYVPKVRLIKALPFSDRVLQHAVNNILEPIFEKQFYEHSYACRKNKGPIKASATLSKWMYHFFKSTKQYFCLKCDIKGYFKNVHLIILLNLYSTKIKDEKFFKLLKIIFEINKRKTELPVGNLTSQLSGNVYLAPLDRYVTEVLKPYKYIRYMDDFLLFSDSKEKLSEMLSHIILFLKNKLHLILNDKTRIFPVKDGVDFVGYVHYFLHKRMRKSTWKRSKKNLKKDVELYFKGKITIDSLRSKFSSLIGRLQHSDSFHEVENLKNYFRKLLSKEAFKNGWNT